MKKVGRAEKRIRDFRRREARAGRKGHYGLVKFKLGPIQWCSWQKTDWKEVDSREKRRKG